MTATTGWMQRHQIALYVGAIVGGLGFGWVTPGSDRLESAINPAIALLLFATFLAVPFRAMWTAVRHARFMLTLGVVNFVLVPVVVFGLSRFVANNDAVLVGVVLVLLAPCVDYVIAFSGLAGAASERLMAATPLLMLAQMVLLPLYLLLFIGSDAADLIEVAPFVDAFLVLIALPLAAAVLVQQLAPLVTWARGIETAMLALMVPLMMVTLAVVVGSQIRGVGEQIGALVGVIPVYVAFVAVMVALGIGAGRWAHLDVPSIRALAFSGVTRNSLVVLPLALALPAALALTPLVVVTQTLVELVAMVVLVRLIPRLVAGRHDASSLTPGGGAG